MKGGEDTLFAAAGPGLEDRGSTRKAAFSHDRRENTKHEWLTPPEILKALGEFDLDPCAPVPEKRPWDTAKLHYDIRQDGLQQPWAGRVWLNPPYDHEICGQFLGRMAAHGNGVVLIYARTETQNYFNHVWPKADAILFIKDRLYFWELCCAHCGAGLSIHVKDFFCKTPSATSRAVRGGRAGAPSALIAYGAENVKALQACQLEGFLINLGHGHSAVSGRKDG